MKVFFTDFLCEVGAFKKDFSIPVSRNEVPRCGMMQIIIQFPGGSVGQIELEAKVFGLKDAEEEIDSRLFVVVRKRVAVVTRDALEEIVGFRLQPRGDSTIGTNSMN